MFNEIKSEKDIRNFLEKTNQLHDGYIISAIYTNNGIKKTESGHSYSPWMTTLTLRILVTSIWDTIVEIEFESLYEWQIYDNFSNIYETTLSFDDLLTTRGISYGLITQGRLERNYGAVPLSLPHL